MLKDKYDLLGVSEYATDREIAEAYFELRKKYHEERYLDGEVGNNAAKKLTELDNAYEEIKRYRAEHGTGDESNLYSQVDKYIKDGKLDKAQEVLDSFDERGAEWHFLQSVIFYKKNWINDCKKQLEIALALDENNQKYKETYDRLLEKIKATDEKERAKQDPNWNKSGSGAGANPNANSTYNYDEPQMGGSSCVDFCCQVIMCNMCLNCCCGMR